MIRRAENACSRWKARVVHTIAGAVLLPCVLEFAVEMAAFPRAGWLGRGPDILVDCLGFGHFGAVCPGSLQL